MQFERETWDRKIIEEEVTSIKHIYNRFIIERKTWDIRIIKEGVSKEIK